MDYKLPILKVHILGGFSILYGDEPVSFGRNSVTKAMKLLQILIYHGEKGIARETILEYLYGREELADVANNLRVTVHRLKKILVDAGLPQYEYVNIKKGIYRWDAPMETQVDARRFLQVLEQADTVDDEEKKIELLKEACLMYSGDFLPDLSGEEWALIEGIAYKNRYSKALKELCQLLMNRGEFEETIKFCSCACEMYPLDEWQSIRIDCYMAMNRYKEAMAEYEATAKLFFEELGISPSARMMSQFEDMSSHMGERPQALKDIMERFKEESENEEFGGAYYCGLPGFRDNYRLVARIIERSGQSVFLMQCSITDGKGHPMEKEEKLSVMIPELHKAICKSLRRGDCFTKYSPSQFLILLVGTNKENCHVIYERIKNHFATEHKSWGQYIEYFVSSIAEVEQVESIITFDKEKSIW